MDLYWYKCKIIRVVDGDTLHVNIDLGLDINTNKTIRLADINAPEMKTPEGKVSKMQVEKWITQNTSVEEMFMLNTIKDKQEKYGRYLGKLYPLAGLTGTSLNEWMVANNFAVPFMVT